MIRTLGFSVMDIGDDTLDDDSFLKVNSEDSDFDDTFLISRGDNSVAEIESARKRNMYHTIAKRVY